MIPIGTKQILLKMLRIHEGWKRRAYDDATGQDLHAEGFQTIGCGRNLCARPLSDDEINYLLNNDVSYFTTELQKLFSWFNDLSAPRQCAILDLTFNIGVLGIQKYVHMIDAIKAKDWATASRELLNSKEAQQVGQRAKDLAKIIETGIFDKDSSWVN